MSSQDQLRPETRCSLPDRLRAGIQSLDRLRAEIRSLVRLRVGIRFPDRLRAGILFSLPDQLRAGIPFSLSWYYFQARGLGSSGLLLPALKREFSRERVIAFSPDGSWVSAGK